MSESLLEIMHTLLADDAATGFNANANGRVYVAVGGREKLVGRFPKEAIEITACKLASAANSYLHPSSPLVEAVLPDGKRVSIRCPPLTLGYSFSIRKPMNRILPLSDFGFSTQEAEELRLAVIAGKNIVIAGQTGSGKTTLASSLIDLIPEDLRIVTIEEVPEIFLSEEKNAERFLVCPGMNIRYLVGAALRADPKRILIGEVRKEEAFDLLTSWNTGHPGVTTIHANSAAHAMTRLKTLVLLSGLKAEEDFFKVVDMVIFLANYKKVEVIIHE